MVFLSVFLCNPRVGSSYAQTPAQSTPPPLPEADPALMRERAAQHSCEDHANRVTTANTTLDSLARPRNIVTTTQQNNTTRGNPATMLPNPCKQSNKITMFPPVYSNVSQPRNKCNVTIRECYQGKQYFYCHPVALHIVKR